MPSSNGGKSNRPEYVVQILPSVQKLLNKLPDATATRIEDKMMALAQDPRPSGYKKLKGRDAYRIHIGDYRGIYEIHDGRLIVIVITIGHRRDVYD